MEVLGLHLQTPHVRQPRLLRQQLQENSKLSTARLIKVFFLQDYEFVVISSRRLHDSIHLINGLQFRLFDPEL